LTSFLQQVFSSLALMLLMMLLLLATLLSLPFFVPSSDTKQQNVGFYCCLPFVSVAINPQSQSPKITTITITKDHNDHNHHHAWRHSKRAWVRSNIVWSWTLESIPREDDGFEEDEEEEEEEEEEEDWPSGRAEIAR